MTKIAYLQCPTGIAGDMCLGALVHAGCPLEYLIEKLNLLGISAEYRLRAENVQRQGQMATKVYVDLTGDLQTHPEDVEKEPPTFDRHHHHHHHDRSNGDRPSGEDTDSRHRHLPEIEEKIKAARLPGRVESRSLAIFRKLAEAEAAVHGTTPDLVHFHEVGATDAIVDIVGTCLGLDWLGIDGLYCSPLPVGGGKVWAAHGRLSVPVPAVLKLWESRRVPVYSNGIEKELVTPTGAAIACTLATDFGEVPPMAIERIGLGAGSRDLALPNILRLWIGSPPAPLFQGRGESGIAKDPTNNPSVTSPATSVANWISELPSPTNTPSVTSVKKSVANSPDLETISVLETQIDDCSPLAIAYTFDLLFAAGALDVFARSITMKKSRLGVLLTAICHPEKSSICEEIIFRETTTLGIRRCSQQRAILGRKIEKVETPYGEVGVKIGKMGDRIVNVHPEYEDCAKLAKKQDLSWREVHRVALEVWYDLRS